MPMWLWASQREGVDSAVAALAAREAQSHIGMATRLATDDQARLRRDESVGLVLGLTTVSSAVKAAADLLDIAKADAAALVERHDASEREELLHSLGIAPGGAVPQALRSQLKTLEEDQKGAPREACAMPSIESWSM